MAAKPLASSAAPPIRPPSMFFWEKSSAALSGLTLPPYWRRTACATCSPKALDKWLRISRWTSSACAGVAVLGDVRHLGGRDVCQATAQLPEDHVLDAARLALLQGLADADNGPEARLESRLQLPVDAFVGLAKVLAALRVT